MSSGYVANYVRNKYEEEEQAFERYAENTWRHAREDLDQEWEHVVREVDESREEYRIKPY